MTDTHSSYGAPRTRGLLLALAFLGLCAFTDARQSGEPFEAALASPPLPPPLTLTGGFCEFRIGHFHAGLDLGTDKQVGKPVLACGDGWVERIRCSGVGYGRSIYLRLDDGRLIQYGHLDAFVEPLAAYVRARQDSSLQYEQDLWPEDRRFRFKAGQPMAWSGESGAGGPHLHFEIRRGDMAYHPMRAGLSIADASPPSIATLTLEPLDDTSFVEGGAAPFTAQLSAAPETLRAIGRVRAIVGARDGVWRGVDRMVPWSVAMEWEGRTVECRFDSVSWATDMAEGEYVYDAGRVVGEKGVVLWAPGGFRPRVLHAEGSSDRDAGTLELRAGDKPRTLRLVARDVAGQAAERSVVLIADRPPGRATAPSRPSAQTFDFVSLPGGLARFTVRGAPEGTTALSISSAALARLYKATAGDRGWSLVMPFGGGRKGAWSEELHIRATSSGGAPWVRSQMGVAAALYPSDSVGLVNGDQRVIFPAGAVFEPGVVFFHLSTPAVATAELTPAGIVMALVPGSLPLRKSAQLRMKWNWEGSGLGLYREGSSGWEWVDAALDTVSRTFKADVRRLGRFCVFRDGKAPRLALRAVPRRAARGPYSRWAAEAAVVEEGSGLDGRASHVVVDGRRVPTEWDSEERILRWRPARAPRKGTHRWEVVAVDRAGNTARTRGTFVLD